MKLIFTKCSVLGFDLEKYDSFESLYLGKFLLEIGARWVDSFKEWALDPKQVCNSSNETYQEKENGFICIGDLFIDDLEDGPYYKLTPEEFIDLLDQWKAAVEARPDVITITTENGRLVVKTMNAANDGKKFCKIGSYK